MNVHHVRIEQAHAHHNPGRTRGVRLRSSTHRELLDSHLERSTLTGMNCDNVQHGRVAGRGRVRRARDARSHGQFLFLLTHRLR